MTENSIQKVRYMISEILNNVISYDYSDIYKNLKDSSILSDDELEETLVYFGRNGYIRNTYAGGKIISSVVLNMSYFNTSGKVVTP